MSVYTTVERTELAAFVADYDIGAYVSHRGISEGISNTNYFLVTERDEYVLTLFELIGFDDVPYYLELMAYLAARGVPGAHPVADRAGSFMKPLAGKPAALVYKLEGRGVSSQPSVAQCRAIGATLAQLHLAGRDFPQFRANDRGPAWAAAAAARVLPKLDASDAALLREELDAQAAHPRALLPQGVIHADLFVDNALFDGDRLCGLIDFYYACTDALAYDLAITLNDWCKLADGTIDHERAEAMVTAYLAVRPFAADEREAWPRLLRAAALRFWLSRLVDKLFPMPGELTYIKDPDEYRRLLLAHRADPWQLG